MRIARLVPALAALVLAIAIGLGCVAGERREAAAAREAYRECEAEHGEEARECEVARARLLEAQERYDEHSRRAWGCNPEQEDCPVPR